jgi:type IV/VI secretion system ImpK/VasF family protein
MSDTSAARLLLAGTFSTIQRLCRKARREENRARKARKKKLQEQKAAGSEASAAPGPKKEPAGADLIALREDLRNCLSSLAAKLPKLLHERDADYAFFPLVVYTDELVAKEVTRGQTDRFRPLQREHLEINNGGELFYDHLEKLLTHQESPPLHPIVFEVFYLCLKAGFLGRHASDEKLREDYKRQLLERIDTRHALSESGKQPLPPVVPVPFPFTFYLLGGAVVLALFALLHLVSFLEVLPRS